MPAHHRLEAYLDAYIKAAGIGDQGKSPLFRSAVGRTDTLTDQPIDRVAARRMIQRRRADLGMRIKAGCHTFRATGITAYLEASGTLGNAQAMAAHESPRTTKLYDRTGDEITLDEVERGRAASSQKPSFLRETPNDPEGDGAGLRPTLIIRPSFAFVRTRIFAADFCKLHSQHVSGRERTRPSQLTRRR
jgi:hypothetical protein